MDRFSIEFEREDDGRWIAECTDPSFAGCMAYGVTWQDAMIRVCVLMDAEGVISK